MKSVIRLFWCLFALASAGICGATNAQAAVTLAIDQVGSNVVASYSGSWNTWTQSGSLDLGDTRIARIGDQFGEGFLALGAAQESFYNQATVTRDSGSWTLIETQADSFTGDPFGFRVDGSGSSFMYAPAGYTAGSTFNGSMTFNNTDIAAMGFTPGETGRFTADGTAINYSVAVPEPATIGMLAVGSVAAGLGFVRRRRVESTRVPSRR